MKVEIQGNKPDPSIFGRVVLLSAVALVLIIVAAVIVVGWRAHNKNKPPYTRHPVSRLVVPGLAVPEPAQTA